MLSVCHVCLLNVCVIIRVRHAYFAYLLSSSSPEISSDCQAHIKITPKNQRNAHAKAKRKKDNNKYFSVNFSFPQTYFFTFFSLLFFLTRRYSLALASVETLIAVTEKKQTGDEIQLTHKRNKQKRKTKHTLIMMGVISNGDMSEYR